MSRISLVVTVLALCAPLHAQPAARTPIAGQVTDASGGALPGATLTLLSTVGEMTAVSDSAGRFVFEAVPEGPVEIAAALGGFAPTVARVTGSRAGISIVLEPHLTERVTVAAPLRIVSATKTETLLLDVPQSVAVVSRELIAEQGMRGMSDVARNVPGMGIAQGEGNRDTPIMRGNNTTADFFVDGVRDDVQYFRDLYNVERVEALKGPNAMVFGRGGAGGVINRVVRQAEWTPSRELGLDLGEHDAARLTADLGAALSQAAAGRVTAMFETSDSYREGATLQRYGVNPTAAFTLGARTTLRAGYERFHDERTADRGVSSFAGRPLDTDPSLFFGNADLSNSRITVDSLSAMLEFRASGATTLRSHLRLGRYDKFYQNVFPGAVDAQGARVSLSAYNAGTERRNVFSQTDLVLTRRTGGVEHLLLAGAEFGRQETDNLRLTGYFTTLGPAVTSVLVPVSEPTTALPLEFRPGATDASNHGVANVAALYVQDQVTLSRKLQAVVGLRYDRFELDFDNLRASTTLSSHDDLLSPRAGLVFKPADTVSLYGSWSLAYVPRAGEQLTSLTLTNLALDPETFRNLEVGAKAEVAGLSLAGALYRLTRGNVIVPDPLDPAKSHLVDAQRTQGLELSASGRVTSAWQVYAGYAYQDGEITRALSSTVPAGARLAQVPKHSFSLWNRYTLSPSVGVGLGVSHRGEVFTSTDNTVVLPGYTRVDAALFFRHQRFTAQVNVENLLDTRYFAFAHSNTNITPGAPRSLRLGVGTRF